MIGASLAGFGQTKPDPKKVYTFTVSIPASGLDSFTDIVQIGIDSLMKTDMPAKAANGYITNARQILNVFYKELQDQIIADNKKAAADSAKKPPAKK